MEWSALSRQCWFHDFALFFRTGWQGENSNGIVARLFASFAAFSNPYSLFYQLHRSFLADWARGWNWQPCEKHVVVFYVSQYISTTYVHYCTFHRDNGRTMRGYVSSRGDARKMSGYTVLICPNYFSFIIVAISFSLSCKLLHDSADWFN